jgi:nucleolar GTP-binding protein
MSRLPSINPFERTLVVAGYPNVGKSSFVNRLTRANVEVQAYPFTTQNLYVGHFEHQAVRWQLLDSPGLLDHPLEEMNTIEMQSVTAMAHLRACILFFIDLSEQCGYPLAKQVALFKSLRPLFQAKPLLILFTKADLRRLADLPPAEKELLQGLWEGAQYPFLEISNLTEENLNAAKEQACALLAEYRQKQNIDKVAGPDRAVRQD